MTEALKPCPVCGCEGLGIHMFDQIRAYVECDWCDARGPLRATETEAEAIAAWNTRTPDPAVQELIEAARGMLDAYFSFLCMKAEDPTRYTGPSSRYHALAAALNKLEKTDDA